MPFLRPWVKSGLPSSFKIFLLSLTILIACVLGSFFFPVSGFSNLLKIIAMIASLSTAALLAFAVPKLNSTAREVRASTNQSHLSVNSLKIAPMESLERMQIEERLAEYAAIIESCDDAILSKGADGIIRTWNAGAERIYGYSAAEVIGKPISLIFPKEKEFANEEQEIFARIKRGEHLHHYETVRIAKGGERVNVSLAVSPLKNSAGEIIGASAIARDIGSRQHTQEILRDQANVLNLAQVLVRDLDDKIVLWNQGAFKLYGYGMNEAMGRNSHDFLKTEFPEPLEVIKSKLMETGVWEGELRHRRRDGTQVIVASTWILQYDGDGHPKRILEANTDITARIRAENALKESERQYRALFDDNPMPMWVFDRATLRFIAVNDAAIHHYGYSREEFLNKTILDIRPSEDIEAVRKSILENVRGLSEIEIWRHRKKDGSLIDVEITTHDVSLNGRDAELVLATDVTEKLRSIEQLQQSEEKFAKAFRASPFPMTISTDEGIYLDVNDAFLKSSGYGYDEVVHHSVHDLGFWVDIHARDALVSKIRESGHARIPELQLRIKSGETRLFEYSAEEVILDGQHCILAIANDITQKKHLEEQFRQAQKMEAVGRLAGGVAHDFNNLLGVIIGYCDISKENLDQDHPVYKHVTQIRKSADRASSLTRQLLAFSRQQVLQFRVLDLNAVVHNVSKMLLRVIGEDIKLAFSPGIPLGSVKADLGQLEQILMNLVINARDAMPQGGRIFIETANVILDEDYANQHAGVTVGNYVLLSVSDTGCGMDQKIKARIFEPFFTTKEPGAGTGLGLSTVYGIVKQSGGNVWVYSEPDKGTTFKIYFPRVEQTSESLIDSRHTPLEITGVETILLVEDDEALRELTISMLRGSGYKVVEAENGNNAIEIAKKFDGKIDLLLTDVVMPGMGGGDLGKELRLLRPQIKVLYTSGYTGNLIAHHGVLDVEAKLLQKPYSKNSLLSTVRAVLDAE